MRNHASAAHPNQNGITGLQISAWLETCIVEVLAKEPAAPAFEVRRLLNSLRMEQLSEDHVPPIAGALQQLPEDLSASLLRAILGMYTDPAIGSQVRDNLRMVANSVWEVVSDDARREAGLKQATLTVNGEVKRASLAREFIEIVEGQEFLTESTLATELSTALDSLMTAHQGWHNFHTEPGPARLLNRLVPQSGSVPRAVMEKYVKTVLMCRIGNGYGVSWEAEPHYDELLARFNDSHILIPFDDRET